MPVSGDPEVTGWLVKGGLFLLGAIQAFLFFILSGMKKDTQVAEDLAREANKGIATQSRYNTETYARRDDVGTMKKEILDAITKLSTKIDGIK